jgi:hypothetical protein
MVLKKRFFSYLFIIIILSPFVPSQIAPQSLLASPRLPNVTSDMERPEFWIKIETRGIHY